MQQRSTNASGTDARQLLPVSHSRLHGWLSMVGLLAILVLILAVVVLPRFYFNELELKFRVHLALEQATLAQVDEAIDARKQQMALSDPSQLTESARQIEELQAAAVRYLDLADDYTEQQRKLLPFLSPEHREYLNLKGRAMAAERQAVESFRDRKRDEHQFTEAVYRLGMAEYQAAQYDGSPESRAALTPTMQQVIQTKAVVAELREHNHISTVMEQHLLKRADGDLFLLNGLALLTDDPTAQVDLAKLKQYEQPEGEWQRLLTASTDEARLYEVARAEAEQEVEQAVMTASNYYDHHALATDPLTKLLSRFSSEFPRVKSEPYYPPTLVPEDTEIESVS